MNTIIVTIKEKIALVSLNKGRTNAIGMEMVLELKDIFQNIEKDDAISGVILTGKGDYFSAGLDLPELFDYSEARIREFWEQYLSLIYILTSFKKPFISAINGHAPAAGTILSLCSDFRVIAEGKFSIGLNEVALGISIPDSFFQLYATCIGRQKANRYLLEGKLFSPGEALAINLVDEVVPPNLVTNTAVKQMQHYLQYNKIIWQESKLNIRRNLIFATQPHQPDYIKKLLEEWWAPYNRSVLQTIIQNFKK